MAPKILQLVLGSDNLRVELSEYERPAGRSRLLDLPARPPGRQVAAVGCRDANDTRMIFQHVKQAGPRWTVERPLTYTADKQIVGAVAHHMKTLSVLPELNRHAGLLGAEHMVASPFTRSEVFSLHAGL